MNFARFFIDRPVMAMVISIVMIIAGVLSIPNLPVAQYPEIAPPTVVVSTSFPGANAQTVADTIAAPIEQQINGVERMLYMSSQATNDGSFRLTVTFQLGTDLDTATVQVQNRVSVAEPQLPDDVRRIGITVRKSSPDLTLAVQLSSPENKYDRLYISNYAVLQVRDQLARLPGVGDTTVFGGRDYSIRVWLNPQKLASLSMTAGDVTAAIREQNIQVAAGLVGAQPLPPGAAQYQLTVNALGRLTSEEQFKDIIVKTGGNGQITRLRDVATVELGGADYSLNAYANGYPAVGIGIFQLPGTNAIATADAVYAKMEELKKSFPPGLDYGIPYDTTRFVRESISDVIDTLLEAIGLVVIVVIVFLQNWRAAVIPLLAIPVSLVATFAVMYLMGFSINNLSLFGVVLAIGIVVDDAIVVVENVERWMEQGLNSHEAARKSMDEVTPAVIAIAFGLSAVFIPTAFISGISGQFYKQFALTIAASALLSAFNSLTLSPALAAMILKPHTAKKDILEKVINFFLGWFFHAFNFVFHRTREFYTRMVVQAIRFSWVMMLLYLGAMYATYHEFRIVPSGFIPAQDAGYFVVNLQMPDAASLDRTDAVMRKLADSARSMRGVHATFALAGYSFLTGTSQSNSGAMFVVMDDFSVRKNDPSLSGNAMLGQLAGKYGAIQEGVALVFPPPPVRGLSTAGGFKLQIEDRSGTLTPGGLEQVTDDLIGAAMKDGHLASAFTTFRANVPQLWVEVDRSKVKSQNIPLTGVFDTLQTFLGSLYVNDFNYLGRTFKVNAQGLPQFRAQPKDILQLKTRNANGEMVPLGAVLNVKEIVGPARLQRYNLYPSAEISGTAAPGVSSGDVIKIMDDLASKNLPPGVTIDWTELTLQELLAGEGWSNPALIFPLCVLFVFLTHSAEYESFPLALAIILIVPMCLFSAMTAIWLLGMENNIFTQIGFVVLVGLAAKNAVLIVEFAKQREEAGMDILRAPIEAARLRLRPILMTSFAFIFGVLPLVLAKGAGAEMRHAIGTAVFYGMIGVTLFGLILTPVFYYVIRWSCIKLGMSAPYTAHRHDTVPI